MTQERATGAVLYPAAALVLAAGAVWWFRAAPQPTVDPRLAAAWASAERVLPDREGQLGARTFVVANGSQADETVDVDEGVYQLYVLCAGEGTLRGRVETFGEGPEQSMPCTDPPTLTTVTTRVAEEFRLTLSSASVERPAVVRWQLMPR